MSKKQKKDQEIVNIENIKDVINPDYHIEIVKDKNVTKVVLTEDSLHTKLKKVTIFGFDNEEKIFAFKLDAKDSIGNPIRISDFLNQKTKKPINKACDGIIFTYLNGKGCIFICEMKSEKPHKADYFQQFRNSSVFIKFINAILNEFYGFDIKDFDDIRYILFDQKAKSNKTPTNSKIYPKKESYDNKELDIYKIHHPKEDRSLDIRFLATS